MPGFLGEQYNLKGTAIALPVAAVYVLSSIGSVGGGPPGLECQHLHHRVGHVSQAGGGPGHGGGMAGGLGGIALTALVQKRMFVHFESIGQINKAYYIMFFICGVAYLLAWVLLFTLVPRMEPINLDEKK